MKPPTMPAEFFQFVILLWTVAGLSPAVHPLPCFDQTPGSTAMPSVVDHVAGLLPAPPS
ncbi:hypothetical protein [Pseudoxanthomonas mexicana]